MRVLYASVALALADEACLDENVLLQVKTQKHTEPGTMPANVHGDADLFDGPPGQIATAVGDAYGLEPDAILDFMCTCNFDEVVQGDETFIEECIAEFCFENDGTDCETLAATATDAIMEGVHDKSADYLNTEYPEAAEGLTECESWSIWPYEECHETPDYCWECHSLGEHIHLNEVHSCEAYNSCGPEDYMCHEQIWKDQYPVCVDQFEEHFDELKGFPTVERFPAGEPNKVCMLEYNCIQSFQDADYNVDWMAVDACVCEEFGSIQIEDEYSHPAVGYFEQICGGPAADFGATDYPMDGEGYPMPPAMIQRLRALPKGIAKKLVQTSGLSRRVRSTMKAAVVAALKQKLA